MLAKKLLSRFFDERGSLDRQANLRWLVKNATDFEAFAKEQNPQLWEETKSFARQLEKRAKGILSDIDVELGGGGYYEMLYFLTRQFQPKVIVETGVAAGFSSQTFLSALQKNGEGKLFSSDFPYFRLAEPEKYIGLLVDEKFKADWTLYIEGDEANLEEILPQVQAIDLFHYDSDKRYRGRQSAFTKVKPKLSQRAIVVFDDIQDNPFFHDLIQAENISPERWRVIAHKGKFIGWVSYDSQTAN